MRLAPALLLTLCAPSIHAAMFEAENSYRHTGTWNDGKTHTLIMWTDPLSQGASHMIVEGEPVADQWWVNFSITFPTAPAGAKNVMSTVLYNYDEYPVLDRTVTVEPIQADCGGKACHYEPPATVGTGFGTGYVLYPLDLTGWRSDLAGKTVDVSVLATPTGSELFPHFAYNSKTTYTWGQGHYDIKAKAVTIWEMDATAVPEPGSFALAGIGFGGLVLGVVRKRKGKSC